MPKIKPRGVNFVRNISRGGLSIYDPIEVGHPQLWIPSPDLELLLKKGLVGFSMPGLANRTKNKLVKCKICELLGYPVPKSFKRTRPRFPGQDFDVKVQKANNAQIYNEPELSALRRYVIVCQTVNDIISDVRVINGEDLALLDKTGTITGKYQARFSAGIDIRELVSAEDTANLQSLLSKDVNMGFADQLPTEQPILGKILPVAEIFTRLSPLVGVTFRDSGSDQERNRGAELHRLVCSSLGYRNYRDDGRFPDIRHQLIEVKLQTSPTIDLGRVLPSSTEPLDLSQIGSHQIRHCDVRYAVFGAKTDGKTVTITSFVLTTGEAFLVRFKQFGGKVVNNKSQIRLPKNFFGIKAK